MRILYILGRYPGFGGIEKVTTVLCNYLCQQIEWIGIYSFEQEYCEELLSELDKSIIFITAIDSRIYDSKNNIKQLHEVLDKNKIDIVVYQDSYSPYFPMVVSSIRGLSCKLVVVEHNTPERLSRFSLKDAIYQNKSKKSILRTILGFYKGQIMANIDYLYKYFHSDRYVLLSDTYYQAFRKYVPFAKYPKLNSINNPNTSGQLLDKIEKKNICLFCARLEKQKGIDHLLNIWREIEEKNLNWSLEIVGNGSLREKIEDYIHTHNLRNITLHGYIKDPTPYYAKAKLFLMTSIFEGWGLTLVEAKSHGCVPILYDSFSAAKKIVNNNRDGILIPAFNEKSFIEKVLFLMEESDIYSQMSENAKNDYERFSVNLIGTQWLGLFIKLVHE